MPNLTTVLLVLSYLFLSSIGVSFAQEGDLSIGKSVLAFRYAGDEQIDADVYLQYTEAGDPLLYSAHLETDVCSDGLCKPVNITIKWDLLGRFTSYHTDEGHALTKFDHIKLTDYDHRQLHRILSDTASILRDYRVEDMIDTTTYVQSQQVDAVTRATSVTFDGATVEGALYTVYTLWHFTNGPIRKLILEHTKTLFSDHLVAQLLASGNRDYVAFAFKNISSEQRDNLTENLIDLVKNQDEYIPHFALAQLKDSVLSVSGWQARLLDGFPQMTSTVRNALLDRLTEINMAHIGLEKLLSFAPGLQNNQIAAIFLLVETNKSQVDDKIVNKIEELSRYDNVVLARHARHTLRKIRL